MLTILIGADEEDVTDELRENTLSIEADLDDVSTCSFELLSEKKREFYTGEKVIIEDDDSDRDFGGVIEDYDMVEVHGNKLLFNYSISCVDYNYLALKRRIGKVYVEEYSGDIVRDFIAEKLHEEGVEEGHIEDGPLINRAVFNYLDFEESLDELTTITGYIWDIDYYKKLHYHKRDFYKAPFNLTEDNDNFNTISISKTKEQYRNQQMIRGSQDKTNPQTITFDNVDPEKKSFEVDYSLAEAPTVWVNGTEKSVGIQLVDSGKDFYWKKEGTRITRDRMSDPFPEGTTVEIEYVGYFPINMIAQLSGEEIQRRQEIEAGSGIYEDVITDKTIGNQTQAEEKAVGLLRKYGRIPRVINFTTDKKGLKPGQLIEINLPTYNLNDEFLIRNVSGSDVNGQFIRYEVEALDGSSLGSWKKFFKDIVRNSRDFSISENEVVTYLRMMEDEVACKDSFEIDTDALEHRIGYGEIGFMEVK